MNGGVNKFYYKVASCWLFLQSHTTMHGSMNIKFGKLLYLVGDLFELNRSELFVYQDSDVCSCLCAGSITQSDVTIWKSGLNIIQQNVCRL
jgi:hypothetical protein